MDEVTVAVIAIAFGLSAVFIPTAFISGITGQFFRQFALTIATSTLISAFNSLTLSPALAAILLKPRHEQRDVLTRFMNLTLGWFFRGFNACFGWMTVGYAHTVRVVIRGSIVALLVFGGLLYATYHGLVTVPTGFIPSQDKGYLIVNVQLPDSASLERTQAVMKRIDAMARETEGVKHTVSIADNRSC
jgi:multidrug efflux pump subunit AcrB